MTFYYGDLFMADTKWISDWFNCKIHIRNLLTMLTLPFTWSYLQAADQEFDLPVKEKSDICTIMYTSGTTGDPKGVLISNASIICLIAGVDRLLSSQNEEVRCSWSSSIMWPYLTHWQTFNIFYNMRISVGGKRRLHVLPSSCTHFWSCCGGIVYFPWCLYWILARGEHQWHCVLTWIPFCHFMLGL